MWHRQSPILCGVQTQKFYFVIRFAAFRGQARDFTPLANLSNYKPANTQLCTLMPNKITDPEVDDALRNASPLHPPPQITADLKLDDDLDIGPITKRVLANDYNRILRHHGSTKFVSQDDAAGCDTVGDARKLVSSHL